MSTDIETPPASSIAARTGMRVVHPVRDMIVRRSIAGVITVFIAAAVVYFATLVLPGDAATAILGQNATPARLALLRHQLGLDRSVWSGFGRWIGGLVRGDFGTSLSQQRPVSHVVGPRIVNSVVLMLVAGGISSVLGIVLGALAAARKDKPIDHVMSVVALVANAMPEFVVGVFVAIIFSVSVFHWFPGVSILPPGASILDEPSKLVLPALTLVIVTAPYVFRMVRATTIEALLSDYAEVALLKGVSPQRLLFRHALPNALAPAVQAIGLNFLYLAGGIVMVETVFSYPGIGQTLVNAISDRDVPLVQFLVTMLAAFYVVLNLVTDIVVLMVTPRRRLPRS